MSETNQYGLSRDIPAAIRRDVRQRSKFGCVVCRCGLYVYEHIDPPFVDARTHDAANICCLCGTCHDAVTRGQTSKKMVQDAYRRVQNSSMDQIGPPIGPLDFHSGTAELAFGGLTYNPGVETILRYYGEDLIKAVPGKVAGEWGSITAAFTDDRGEVILRLSENEWIGTRSAWDIEVEGRRLIVRRARRAVSLQLRLDPPGRVVIEHLDMRIRDSHVLATERSYVVGRYTSESMVHWVHATAAIRRSSPAGAAIEITDPGDLEHRDQALQGTGVEMATADRTIVLSANAGMLAKPLGVAIASLCGGFDLVSYAIGSAALDDMRRVIRNHPDQVCRFISGGGLIDESPG